MWILRLWNSSGRNTKLKEAEFTDIGALIGDTRFNMAAHIVKKTKKIMFDWFAEEFVKSHTETQLDGELNAITSYAEKFLGTRYRLGASGPNRFDCSGFVGYVFRNFGYNLNRDSRSQYLQGDKVETAELRPGDLLFFSSRSSGKGRVGHVAIVLTVNPDGSCTFIHASSSKKGVVRQKFPDNGYYSKHFIGAKRIVGSSQFS